MRHGSLSSYWILWRQEVDLIEVPGEALGKRGELLSQGGQGHWAPETGMRHPIGREAMEGQMEES